MWMLNKFDSVTVLGLLIAGFSSFLMVYSGERYPGLIIFVLAACLVLYSLWFR